MTAPRAIYLPTLGVIRITDGGWIAEHSASELPRWIAFYTALRDRNGGKYADKYQPTIDALEKTLRGMDERTHTDTGRHSPAPRPQDRRHS